MIEWSLIVKCQRKMNYMMITQHFWRLPSVMTADARLMFSSSSSRFDHITPLLCRLHWPKLKEKIDVLVFKCVRWSAPLYVADELLHPANSHTQCRLCSALSCLLVIRQTLYNFYSFMYSACKVTFVIIDAWLVIHNIYSYTVLCSNWFNGNLLAIPAFI